MFSHMKKRTGSKSCDQTAKKFLQQGGTRLELCVLTGAISKSRIRTIFLLDNRSDVDVQSQDDQVGEEIHPPDTVEPCWVLEGNLLRHLHHPQDHNKVGSTLRQGRLLASEGETAR